MRWGCWILLRPVLDAGGLGCEDGSYWRYRSGILESKAHILTVVSRASALMRSSQSHRRTLTPFPRIQVTKTNELSATPFH